ncbi:hypothetical protein GCM10009600_15580 [Oerskovia paurometabola]
MPPLGAAPSTIPPADPAKAMHSVEATKEATTIQTVATLDHHRRPAVGRSGTAPGGLGGTGPPRGGVARGQEEPGGGYGVVTDPA